jgi:hypothetical protein
MPWKASTVMEERLRFVGRKIRADVSAGQSFLTVSANVARRSSDSRTTKSRAYARAKEKAGVSAGRGLDMRRGVLRGPSVTINACQGVAAL